MAKYKPKAQDLDKQGEIKKYEHDKIPRHQVMEMFHKETQGMPVEQKREMLKNFFNRRP